MLDDDELIACSEVGSATTSPSCATTGDPPSKYTSRVENYLRIRRNSGPANSWEVTAKDGTVYSYTALDGGSSATAFRWYLASVTDLHDNHVDYTIPSRRPGVHHQYDQILQLELFLGGGDGELLTGGSSSD